MPETLKLITPPTEEPITIAQAKAHLRLIDSTEDDLVATYLSASRQHAEAVTGRQLMPATWQLTLDEFPADDEGIILRPCPVSSITSIVYTDIDGSETTLSTSRYSLLAGSEPASVITAFATPWPAARDIDGAVKITFVAGYATATDVPEPIKAYIRLHLGSLHASRESELVGSIRAELGFVERLLDNWRVP